MNDFELENWFPMDPVKGPPLPRFLNIHWPWYKQGEEPPPEPPETGVVIGLKNPPSDAENWSLSLCDWDITVLIKEVTDQDRLAIGEVATFEIPSGVSFPLRVAMMQLTKWKIPGEVLQQVYYIQAMHPTKWDWNTGEYGDEPDPTSVSYTHLTLPTTPYV